MREIKFRAWIKEKKEMIDNARPDFFVNNFIIYVVIVQEDKMY